MEHVMTNTHLSDRDMYTFLIEPENFAEHLELHFGQCEDCRTRFNRIREFTTTFRTHIDEADTDWKKHKDKILSAVSQTQTPMLRWRLATAVIISCLVIVSALYVRHAFVQKASVSKIDETGESGTMWIVAEEMGENELPQTILILGDWEREDFPQFLNFFTPIEEAYDEEKNSLYHGIHNSDSHRSVVV
jgi:hypothetical protein